MALLVGLRGKSGLHRVGRQVTPGRCEPTESAAESKPPSAFNALLNDNLLEVAR